MRTGATLFHTIHSTVAEATATAKTTFTPPATIQHSPWHSPIPYLFGGLAAMLGLIAFALLILACSYWKLSGQVNGEDGERNIEGGTAEKGEGNSDRKVLPIFEEKFLVIMAGDMKPTFLATPMTSRAGSFNEEKIESDKNEKEDKMNGKNQEMQENGEGGESHVSQDERN